MSVNDIMKRYDKVGRAQFKYTIPEYASKSKKSRNHAMEVVRNPVVIQTENSNISAKHCSG